MDGALILPQRLRQLGEVHHHAPSFVVRHQVGGSATAGRADALVFDDPDKR